MQDAALRAVEEQVARCNRCGFCQAACPIYHITGHEAATARGHNELVREMLAGNLGPGDDVEPSFAQCLLCRACAAHCFPALPTERVVTAARAVFNRRRPGAALEERVMRSVLGNQGRMARLVRLAYFGKRSGALRALRLLRWLPWLPKGLAEADAIMPQPPSSFLRERVGARHALPLLPAAGPRGTVTYFVGCGMNFGFPDAAEDSLRLLAAGGYGVRVADNVCCGLPAYTHGHLELARELARANLAILQRAEIVVSDCASCSSFLKHYADLLADEPNAAEAASAAGRVRDLSEVIEPETLARGARSLGRAVTRPRGVPRLQAKSRPGTVMHGVRYPGAVTFHQPCHLGRYQGLAARPRELLGAIEGLEFRPLREEDWCCGAAGTYVISQHEMSMQVLARKMANVAATGAETVVTSCPACMAQLGYGARQHGLAVRVRHLSQVLCEAR